MRSGQELPWELETAPEPLVREVLDFPRFLKSKAACAEARATAVASESALAADWLRPEEDEAWKDL